MPTKHHKKSGYCVIIVLHHNRLQQTTFSWKIATEDHFHDGHIGALMIRPPTNRPRDISTHTIRPPNKPSAVTFYYCDIPSQGGRIVRPPKIVTFRPSKFGQFVTV
jgi:hypothetical protein